MNEPEDQEPEQETQAQPEDGEDQAAEPESLIDILSGEAISTSPKNKLVQSVLRQLIETYGFDRNDLRGPYRLTTAGKRQKTVDIAILRRGAEGVDENVDRIVVCIVQKKRDKLRSLAEADADLQVLREKMQLFPSCSLGMWTNGQEEFFLKATETKFEMRFLPMGAWPAPGEFATEALEEGGVTQVAADPENLGTALARCFQYLNKNLGLDHKAAFQQVAVLLIGKLYDETLPPAQRRFWVRGDEPFEAAGQAAIQARIQACVAAAKGWRPELFVPGWDLFITDAAHLARLVAELARYSLSETIPRSRTLAYRSIVRSTMDGREGRYPTPHNVAEMAVEMVNPGPDDRVLDCSSGTGTFLAMTAAHMSETFIRQRGTTSEEAPPELLLDVQQQSADWAANHLFGCEIDPYLAATTRLNLLLTSGHPGQVFRIDARTFPDGDLDGVSAARAAIPDGSMDLVLTNPWFSTSASGIVTDESILRRYDLGKRWIKGADGNYSNTGHVKTDGVPPEVLFTERAWRWAKPGTGRVAILLPDGLLGNPSDEDVRWWILQHCEVLASVDLPIEPFKVTVKEYKLTPALPSLLVLRRRSDAELKQPVQPDYWVFMAVVDKAGVDPRGNLLYQRAPDGEELVFEEAVVERVREGGRVEAHRVLRRQRRIADELPVVSSRFRDFEASGRKGE
jgi:type I restriction enzyme M protein